jgi:hypothetical protein
MDYRVIPVLQKGQQKKKLCDEFPTEECDYELPLAVSLRRQGCN